MITLAQMLATGDGVPVDFARAKGLLEQAVALGGDSATSAWSSLGDLYLYADAAHRDPAKAVEAYQRAIDLGDAGAMVGLARMLAAGDGVRSEERRVGKECRSRW